MVYFLNNICIAPFIWIQKQTWQKYLEYNLVKKSTNVPDICFRFFPPRKWSLTWTQEKDYARNYRTDGVRSSWLTWDRVTCYLESRLESSNQIHFRCGQTDKQSTKNLKCFSPNVFVLKFFTPVPLVLVALVHRWPNGVQLNGWLSITSRW